MDVDLPEIEDLPTETAEPAARGFKLNIRRRSDANIRKTYARHVHGIVFRCVAVAFATLPTAQQIQCAAYSQRVEPSTGVVRDTYLLSVLVERTKWNVIEFSNLGSIEVLECLEMFDLRREMSSSGALVEIQPHDPLHDRARSESPVALESLSASSIASDVPRATNEDLGVRSQPSEGCVE
jgi:hypothetical protein